MKGALYHVMHRGVGRVNIFRDDADRRVLLEEIHRHVEEGNLVVHAFCFMGKVDDDGNVLGFSVLRVSALKKTPLEFAL